MAIQPEPVISDAPVEHGAAHLFFREQIKLLPGVLNVEEREDLATGKPSFKIHVRQGDRDTQYAVYGLEVEVYQRFPGAFVDVQVLVSEAGDRNPMDSQANLR